MKNRNQFIAILTGLCFSFLANADVLQLDLDLTTSGSNPSPDESLILVIDDIFTGIDAIPADNRTSAQNELYLALDYIVNTAAVDDPAAIAAVKAISPKKNTVSTSVTRKSPASVSIKAIGKRLAALRKSVKRYRYNPNRPFGQYGSFNNQENPALASGGLLDQRLSGFITSTVTISKQADTNNEAGFEGNTKQFTLGVDYRIDSKTFAGIAGSLVSGSTDISQNGGTMDNNAKTLLFYGTHNIRPNWYIDSTLNIGSRQFEMDRTVNFTLNNNTVTSTANSKPEGGLIGLSVGTGYDFSFNNGHSISLLGSFTYNRSNIGAFKESNAGGFNLAVDKQTIVSKMLDVGVEWRQAISADFGVLLPQLSVKWSQELENKSDPINAYFIADPQTNRIKFETGNADQGYMNLLLGVTAVLPRGLMVFAQYEAQQFIDDYQQYMVSIGGRKEF